MAAGAASTARADDCYFNCFVLDAAAAVATLALGTGVGAPRSLVASCGALFCVGVAGSLARRPALVFVGVLGWLLSVLALWAGAALLISRRVNNADFARSCDESAFFRSVNHNQCNGMSLLLGGLIASLSLVVAFFATVMLNEWHSVSKHERAANH